MSVLLCLSPVTVAACGSTAGAGFGNGDGGPDSSLPPIAESGTAPPTNGTDAGSGPGFNDDAAIPGMCKAGLYSGTFTGTYSSSITLVGVPLPVTGNLSMTLEQSVSAGEVPVFTIANGTISGLADALFPFFCNMSGTLDCVHKKLKGGMIDCQYCVGGATGTLGDGGTCLIGAHFKGPLNSDYDGTTFSFVNGTWNGSEELTDGGATLNDGGVYLGPGDYGGSGTWTASLQSGDP